MKYRCIEIADDVSIPAKHSFTRKTLKYVCEDQYDIGLFFAPDELYPVSRSPRYAACVERLHKAIANKEKVVVYGDYDVDGITATTICYDMLTNLQVPSGYYIPNRMIDGYGLNKDKVVQFHEKGYTLIICVDNGVVAHEAISYAASAGIDVIILDHHEMDDKTPTYPYVIHPDLLEPEFRGMSGSGMVFEFSRSFLEKPQYVMLAALGTIADMMVLVGQNRRLVRQGLRLLREEKFLNLRKLAKDDVIDEFTLAMQIAPKLNTLGRLPDLANTNQVVRYFMIHDEKTMDSFIMQVDKLNETRRQMAKDMTMLAETMIQDTDPFLIVADEAFHEGLVGLVANQLVHKYGKPVMVCTMRDGICKGSIRSVDGLDLVMMMRSCPNVLKFGGHKAAGGITFEARYLEDIRKYIFAYLMSSPRDIVVRQALVVDPVEITMDAVYELSQLRPLLSIQKEPRYVLKKLPLGEPLQLSNGQHLKWNLNPQTSLVFFNHGLPLWKQNWEEANFVVKVTQNVFRGRTSLNLVVEDVFWEETQAEN